MTSVGIVSNSYINSFFGTEIMILQLFLVCHCLFWPPFLTFKCTIICDWIMLTFIDKNEVYSERKFDEVSASFKDNNGNINHTPAFWYSEL